MVDSKREQKIFQMLLFRQNMGVLMPKDKLNKFWDANAAKFKKYFFCAKLNQDKKKIQIVEKNLEHILFKDWVKFVGITGSVAAGTSEKDDDIDVFIVVKNGRMWIYRAILTLRLGRKSLRRVWEKPYKDKIDTNFICEERGLYFNTESIFVLHELLFMIPVYNNEYYENILNINSKLLGEFCIKRKKECVNNQTNFILKIFDSFAFIIQYLYMLFKIHRPDWKRLIRNNRKGRIAFFPENFRKQKVKEYKNFCKNFNQV